MKSISQIVALVTGAVPLGLAIAILAGGVTDADTQRSLLTIGMLFAGLGLLIMSANGVAAAREKPRD